jgi:hypothetical protein
VAVSDFLPSENSGVPFFAQLPASVATRAEIFLVLNNAESIGCKSAGSGRYLNPRARGHRVATLPSSRDGSGK